MDVEEKLPEKFNSDGFSMALVERNGDLAIYTQSKFGRVIAWEAVEVRHRGQRTLPNGKVIGPQECYPSPTDFGYTAWSCASLDRARQRLAELRERRALRS